MRLIRPGEVCSPVTGRRMIAGLGLLLAAAVALWLAGRAVAPGAALGTTDAGEDGTSVQSDETSGMATVAMHGPSDAEGATAGAATADEAPPPGLSRRAWLERAIREAREERLARTDRPPRPSDGTGTAASPDEPGHLDPDYIRSRVRELVPLLAECYELAAREQPGLEGRLVVEFAIAGEPGVGGIVEESRIDDASTLRHPTLDECVRETMYTVELHAPEGGGRVTVRYPFTFSPGDDDE